MELNERITRWREWKGLSQAALAKKLDLSPSAVAQWEIGATAPSVNHLDKFVEILGVSMERFYGRIPRRAA